MRRITIAGIFVMLALASGLGAEERIPDLTKGEGPTLEEAKKKTWYLHCAGCRGWAYRDAADSSDAARQILVTEVPADSAVRRQLRVGDVILGVNGRPFSTHAVREFRRTSKPAQDAQGTFNVTLWRKGWDEPREMALDLTQIPLDFTKGDQPGKASDWNLGPTGARGWLDWQQLESTDARQILVTKVEEGSPADGILEEGDVILGLGGRPFTSDARKAIANAITAAETERGGGRLELIRWRQGERENVTISLPVMGSYSETAPFDCEKSQKILDAACAYLVRNGIGDGIVGSVNALGLLASGKEEYLPAVREFVYKLNPSRDAMPSWHMSYATILAAEYYLLTGDEKILPKVREMAQAIAEGQSWVGTWGHGFADPETGVLAGYGAVNQPGITCAISLALARKCGIESPAIERAIDRANVFFSYYINKGSIPYGDHAPYDVSHDNNGVCSSVTVFFDLIGNTEGKEFFSRMTVASYRIREPGHTGNFWSFLWAAPGANRAGEEACAAFEKELWWFFDLERRWDGGFTYQGKDSTPGWDCTGARILLYALPLKKLYITGREMTPGEGLTGKALAETLAAGEGVGWRTRETIYDGRPKEELLELLGSWSPIVRARAAASLGKVREDVVDDLIALYEKGDLDARLGVLVALRRQGAKAAPAVPFLTELLVHEDARMRVGAIQALAAIGEAARSAVPRMLEVACMEFDDDPRNHTRRNLCPALFGRGGLLAESLDGVDRKALFAAVRKMIRVDDGRARGQVARLYQLMPLEELKPILPDILWAVENPSPSGIMFAAGIRNSGLKLLAEHHVKEAIPLLVRYAWDQQQWGSQSRMKQIMAMLVGYGVHAKSTLPELRRLAEWCRTEKGFPEWARKEKRECVEEAIRSIEAATAEPELVNL